MGTSSKWYLKNQIDAETWAALVKEIDGPVNVVMGLVGRHFSVNQLEDVGVKRVTFGGALARATFSLIRRAAQEISRDGTFNFADDQVSDEELCEFFSAGP